MKRANYSNAKKLAWLPGVIRDPLVILRNNYRQAKLKRRQRRELKQALRDRTVKKIIVGAGGTQFEDWVPTNKEILNLLVESDWADYFDPDSLNAILAEHVWEHLSLEDGVRACKNCFVYLKQGGLLRIAVPDGLHPDADYIAQVKPGGYGAGADDHKILYDYRTLSALLENAGYKVRLLEWFDEQGNFHHVDWDVEEGFIERSTRFDERNRANPTAYTSLIIDAIKP